MSILQDKVILVTGGSGLLGRAMVKDIVQKKGTAVNVDISVTTDLTKGLAFCDITDFNSIGYIVAKIQGHYGRIDGLVNNAYPRTSDWGADFHAIKVESWQKNVDMQLNSTFVFCQEVLKVMAQQGFGSIVNISSIYGVVGNDFSIYEGTTIVPPAAYSAIKGGIINFSRYLAAKFGSAGIRVNCISPGGIFDQQNPIFVKKYEEKVPLKRMGTPEDVAPAVTFLLSDEARYITGHNLMVDGGWTCV